MAAILTHLLSRDARIPNDLPGTEVLDDMEYLLGIISSILLTGPLPRNTYETQHNGDTAR
jgi:hypothetical protein